MNREHGRHREKSPPSGESPTAFVLINYLLLSEGLPPIVIDLVKSCEAARTYLADPNRSILAEEIRYAIYKSLHEYDALTPLG